MSHLLTQSLRALLPLQTPFGYEEVNYTSIEYLDFNNTHLFSDFSASSLSKKIGYIPIIGTIVGIYRIFKNFSDYQQFNKRHYHAFSQLSKAWMLRGAIELVPVLGGIINIVIDVTTRYLKKDSPKIRREIPAITCNVCNICKVV